MMVKLGSFGKEQDVHLLMIKWVNQEGGVEE